MKISIVGGSGYAGGDLLRILLFHPEATIHQVTSERYAGKLVHKAHPNLRGITKQKFCSITELEACDTLFVCLPHGKSMEKMPELMQLAPKIIDLGGDFRLNDAAAYQHAYGHEHTQPELLPEFIYGIPELHRKAMQSATHISSAGCNATATILALWPLYQRGLVDHAVVEVKAGSSQGGASSSDASHHPERSGCVRSYKPTGHRHVAEMRQELNAENIHFSATSIEMVRGILATCHVFLKEDVDEKAVWKRYREAYGEERVGLMTGDVTINADAHFGREVYQELLVRYCPLQ